MGFTPLASSPPARGFTPGFTPLTDHEEEPSSAFAPAIETVKNIGRVYPVLETAGNLATQAIAMPVAGIAGLGAVATKAMGLTDTEPADVVHRVAGALTYQPQTESGQHLTNVAMYPFEKLQQARQYVGGKTLDATGSPALATVADTAVNVLPMALPLKAAGPKGVLARAADKHLEQQAVQNARAVAPEAMAVETPHAQVQPAVPVETVLARNAQEAMTQPDAGLPLAEVRKASEMPLNQIADSIPVESVIAEAPKVAIEPRAGFTPIEEAQARVTPPEVRETPQAIPDAPVNPQALLDAPYLDRVHETAPRPATLEATPLGLPEQQRAIEAATPALDAPAVVGVTEVPKPLDAEAMRTAMPENLSAVNQTAVPQKMGEVFNQPALLSESDIPQTLRIANPATGKGQYNGRMVMRIANENVSKLESLKAAGYDGASILDADTRKAITAATNQRMMRGGMNRADARTYAVKPYLMKRLPSGRWCRT